VLNLIALDLQLYKIFKITRDLLFGTVYIFRLTKLIHTSRDTHVSACLLDISFVVDYSGSIMDSSPPGINNWQFIIEFMVKVVSSINIGERGTHVGAVSFGT